MANTIQNQVAKKAPEQKCLYAVFDYRRLWSVCLGVLLIIFPVHIHNLYRLIFYYFSTIIFFYSKFITLYLLFILFGV